LVAPSDWASGEGVESAEASKGVDGTIESIFDVVCRVVVGPVSLFNPSAIIVLLPVDTSCGFEVV
jgi:hypothetical protein